MTAIAHASGAGVQGFEGLLLGQITVTPIGHVLARDRFEQPECFKSVPVGKKGKKNWSFKFPDPCTDCMGIEI